MSASNGKNYSAAMGSRAASNQLAFQCVVPGRHAEMRFVIR